MRLFKRGGIDTGSRLAFRQHHSALSETGWDCWPTVRTHGVEPDGTAYFVTDAVGGCPLDELLGRQGPFELGVAARLVLALCVDLERSNGDVELFRALEPEDIRLRRDDHGAWLVQIAKIFCASALRGGLME